MSPHMNYINSNECTAPKAMIVLKLPCGIQVYFQRGTIDIWEPFCTESQTRLLVDLVNTVESMVFECPI